MKRGVFNGTFRGGCGGFIGEGEFFEFKEVGKDSKNLSIEQVTKFITEQKEKI